MPSDFALSLPSFPCLPPKNVQRSSRSSLSGHNMCGFSRHTDIKISLKHVRLSGCLHIEERLNEGPRLQRKHEDENEAKQNKRNTRESRHDICFLDDLIAFGINVDQRTRTRGNGAKRQNKGRDISWQNGSMLHVCPGHKCFSYTGTV